MEDTLYKLEKLVTKELDKIVAKGDITPSELEVATKAVCLIEKIKMIDEKDMEPMYDPEYSRNYSEAYRSYRPYRSNNSYKDYYIQERSREYPIERGYSSHSVKDRMISHLETTMMDEAQSENERKVIESMIRKLSAE